MHRGAEPVPTWSGEHRGSCLLGSPTSVINLFHKKDVFVKGDFFYFGPAVGMMCCPQVRCRGSRLHGSSTFSQDMRVSE